MTRFAVDATAVSPVGKGISRVMRGAAEALARRGVDVVALVQPGVALEASSESVHARPAVLWEQVGLARAARRFDCVLTPTERLPVAGRGRFVVWLYETPARRLAANRGAYQRGSDLLTRVVWKRSLQRAAAVVAGSHATAREVDAELPGLHVRVIYPGLDPEFSPGVGPRGEPYVFHLGSSDPRDNTEAVLRAVALARMRLPIRLVVGGVTARVDAGAEYTGRISDEELVTLYRGAAAYLDASLFEGFGYQALEAMACGTPFVGSNATSIPEVVGDAGLLVDPRDPEALADALVHVLEEPGLADELRRRGLERAREFTWERTAEQFAALFEELTA
ncbi:MAG TPA: glycosyltransferase family 1 protein [Gaiellaceae bacterium]